MRIWIILTLYFSVSFVISGCVNQPCEDNNGCLSGLYCKKAPGDCESDGICSRKPENCMEIFAPVCGCNGTTYPNECSAAMAGINVNFDGECASNCTNNTDCSDETYYCKKHIGYCDSGGVCTDRPDACPEYYSPVCGCDGNTYSNCCDAESAGINVLHVGEC